MTANTPKELTNQRALVTGGASGIGRATALALARAGARVWLADVDCAGMEAVRARIESEGGVSDALSLDITDEASIATAARTLAGEHRPLDILVNAAGWDRLEPFVENSLEFIEEIVRLNLLGPIKLTHAILPGMIEAGRGRIVNVSSDAGRVGSSGETVYAGAKGGVIAFTKSLARETARHGIGVNCVCPGPTDTPLFRSLPAKMQQALVRAIPFRRLAQPEEIASAILYFAGPGAGFVTGQVLSVSGGLTMAG